MGKSKFSTRLVVATGIGAALCALMFLYIKVPTFVPNTQLQLAYGISTFLGCIFGPLVSCLSILIGHTINDALSGGCWWSWIFASGVSGLIVGLYHLVVKRQEGSMTKSQWIIFGLVCILSHVVAFGIVAPFGDVLIYNEPLGKVFYQSFSTIIMNSIVSIVIGGALLFAYNTTKTSKGSLKKQ